MTYLEPREHVRVWNITFRELPEITFGVFGVPRLSDALACAQTRAKALGFAVRIFDDADDIAPDTKIMPRVYGRGAPLAYSYDSRIGIE